MNDLRNSERLRLLVSWIVFVGGFLAMPLTRATADNTSLPAAADRQVDFHTDILPILNQRCAGCHATDEDSGGLRMKSRQTLLAGGDSGPTVVVGKSAESLLIQLVSGVDPDRVMPGEGKRLTADQIGLLRAWIDQGLAWDAEIALAPAAQRRPLSLVPPRIAVSDDSNANPIDLLLAPYFRTHHVDATRTVDDRTFYRRASMDLIGLIPSAAELEAFEENSSANKRHELVAKLIDRQQDFAAHWMTFWNDALRNEYRGTGYIDGGRKQITGWLYESLLTKKPFDQFVRELIDPVSGSEGFLHGIKWRGTVNASQRREMQAAQTVSQVFFGVNLKCASCHDSFINDWRLDEAYGFANVFADEPMETHRCEKPSGESVPATFIYPELGQIDGAAPRAERLQQLAELMTKPENGRLAQTIVNRLWALFFGRGIVRTVDDMDAEPFSSELLDWLAADLQNHDYDLAHTMRRICTSRAYQLVSVDPGDNAEQDDVVFRGPLVRRLTAEQFLDAVATLTGIWPAASDAMLRRDGRGQGGQLADIYGVLRKHQLLAENETLPRIRSVFRELDTLSRGLGRPTRDQVATARQSLATTLQAIELMNGQQLDSLLKQGAEKIAGQRGAGQPDNQTSLDVDQVIAKLYLGGLGRRPTADEIVAARELLGSEPQAAEIHDLLWTIVMLPEFQLIY